MLHGMAEADATAETQGDEDDEMLLRMMTMERGRGLR